MPAYKEMIKDSVWESERVLFDKQNTNKLQAVITFPKHSLIEDFAVDTATLFFFSIFPVTFISPAQEEIKILALEKS